MADSFEGDVQEAIGRACPHLSQEELSSAVEAFLGYIEIVNDIHDGLSDAPERSAAVSSLTASLQHVTVEAGPVRAFQSTNPTT